MRTMTKTFRVVLASGMLAFAVACGGDAGTEGSDGANAENSIAPPGSDETGGVGDMGTGTGTTGPGTEDPATGVESDSMSGDRGNGRDGTAGTVSP